MDQWLALGDLPTYLDSTGWMWVCIVAVVGAVAGAVVRVVMSVRGRKTGDWTNEDAREWSLVTLVVALVCAAFVAMCTGVAHMGAHNAAVADLVVTYVEDTAEPMTVLSPVRVLGPYSLDGLFLRSEQEDVARFEAITDDGVRVEVEVSWPDPGSLETFRPDADLPDSFDPFTVDIDTK